MCHEIRLLGEILTVNCKGMMPTFRQRQAATGGLELKEPSWIFAWSLVRILNPFRFLRMVEN